METTSRRDAMRYSHQPMSRPAGGWKRGLSLVCLVLAAAMASPAQDDQASPNTATFKTLVTFDGTNGANPGGALVQGPDGYLYGTTVFGGANNSGTVFKISPRGSLVVLYNFCSQPNCTDGAYPDNFGSLALGNDGNLYGVTFAGGGPSSGGTVFKITPTGKLSTLYRFCSLANCSDGGNPDGGLVLGDDGNFYGTTLGYFPGAADDGTVFKVTPQGVLTTLYNFSSSGGGQPTAGVIQATDGNFYGTSQTGGLYFQGSVFKITPKGTLTTAHSFCAPPDCADGIYPLAPVVQGYNGNFYGTVSSKNGTPGTVFEIDSAGVFTTLYTFCAQPNCTDGDLPYAANPLTQATDGNLYGTTMAGGANNTCSNTLGVSCGTIFKITPQGTLTSVLSFDGAHGANPTNNNGFVQATNGALYATVYGGGTNASCNGCGTIVVLSTGLRPFVSLVPKAGKVGQTIQILGTNLTGATSVTFNGTAATFKVASDTLIWAAVPAGATNGIVTVATPTSTLKSKVRFQLLP